ncbi:hypothetical protein EBU95_20415, partial [bacterium]|nr:hypothetical protein [bacterium]
MGLSVNFGDFVNKTGFSLSASDYLVGFTTDYDGNRQEIRITVEDFITYIESNSANDLYTILNQNSGKWDSVYLSVSPNSGYWDSVYNTVNTVSSSWTTGGTSLTTVLNYLSTNVTRLSGLSFSDSVKIYPIITKNYTIALIGAISGVNFSVSFNAASASGDRSFAANSGKATGEYSFAEGLDTSSSGSGSHSEGYQTIASGTASHSEGVETAATGSGSHSEGYKTNAIGGIGGIGNHAEGGYTATGEYVPYVSYDSNLYAFTFSNDLSAKFSNVIPGNILRGYYSDFKGTTLFTFTLKDRDTINGVLSATTNIDISPSSGFIVLPDDKPYKHAEGMFSQAVGRASHAEGINTVAFGDYSHSAGFYSKAAHNRTWIWKGSTTTNLVCTTRTDQFMVSAEGGVFIPSNVGINTDDNTNALTVQGTISAKNLVVTGNLSALGVAYYTSVSFVTASSASYTDIVVTNLTATRIVNSKLDTVYSTTNTNSSYWSLAYNNLIGNSASYLSAYNISLINANSAKWDVAYTNLLYNSANYLTGTAVNLGNIPSLSSYWTEAYTNLVGN